MIQISAQRALCGSGKNIRTVAVDKYLFGDITMVDYVKELQAFRPINMERIPTDDKRYTPQVKIAFELYNKALGEIREGYRDIAKSDLRKAVALCPEFSAAIMVLGILVFANGDRIGAVRIFNSVKDSEDRARAIAILDRLISEAEKPVNSGRDSTYYNYSSAQHRQYSSSREPEREEPQASRPQTRNTYRNAGTYSNTNSKDATTEAAVAKKEDSATYQKQPDVVVTNKALLVIVALLIAFAIAASAIIVSLSTGNTGDDGAMPTANPGVTATNDPNTEDNPQSTNDVDYPLY